MILYEENEVLFKHMCDIWSVTKRHLCFVSRNKCRQEYRKGEPLSVFCGTGISFAWIP